MATSLRQTGHLSYTYKYDRYGNMWHGDGTLSLGFSGGNNRIDGFSYDAAGNVLNDGVHSYTYDAENRLVSVDGGATSYFYDAEGRRLEKRANGTPTFDYFYGRDGNLLILIQTNVAPLYQEIYAGGMHLATHTLNAAHNGTDTYFHHADRLGTERARTDWAGNLCETVTSLPFGDDQNISTSCAEGDVSPMHFTGKERDSESNLDNFGARYDSSAMGRFMSPDWSVKPQDVPYADFSNPQSLNLYAYAKNNPVTLNDPDGHCTADGENHGWLWCAAHAIGLVETLHEQAEDARRFFTANQVTINGNLVDPSKLSDKQVVTAFNTFNADWRTVAQLGPGAVGVLGAALTPSGDLPTLYRGGTSLEASAADVKVDPQTGLLRTTHGVSLDTEASGLGRFGGAHEIDPSSVPSDLQVIQGGSRGSHYEIVPRVPMTMDRYQELLSQIKLK